MAGKFDLKQLKSKPLDVQKDIDNTEKNRIIEKKVEPVPERRVPEEIYKPIDEKKNADIKNVVEKKPQEASKKTEEKSNHEDKKTAVVVSSTKVDTPDFNPQKTASKQPISRPEKISQDEKLNADLISLRDQTSPTSVSSITVPEDIRNYLKCMPKIKGITITQFLGDIFIAKQEKFIKAGIDINAEPDFAKLANLKIRSKSDDLCVVPLKLRKTQIAWLKKASLHNGQNVSQFIEELVREDMK